MRREWNLGDIYDSIDDERLSADRSLVHSLSSDFRSKFCGNISVSNISETLPIYESILRIIEKISSYSFLYLQTRLDDEVALSFFQQMSEFCSSIYSDIIFYTIEISNLNYDDVILACSCEFLSKYRSFFEDCFKYRGHLLGLESEEVCEKKRLTSRAAWIRLYDEILSGIQVDFDGSAMNLPEILELASHSSDSNVRERAAKKAGEALESKSFYIKHIYNNILLDCSIENKLRKFDSPEEFRHLDNNIDRRSVDFLCDAVVEGYQKTSQKYYKIKAKLLGKDRLEYWDRNAPIQFSGIFSKKIEYNDAAATVVDSFEKFSLTFADIAKQFIEKSWIDVEPKKGKASGAFSHPCSVEVHPYILLNYFGGVRDVSTLAHELGHGVHQILASANGPILANTPLTLSEVASLFAEKLLFEEMFSKASNDLERIDMLCSKLDDTINSVMRQIAFFEFERTAHAKRACSELSATDLCDIFIKTQRQCLGDFVNIDDSIRYYWCYISHFFHSPFYVYAYAFAEIFVNSLYARYQESPGDFVEKYIEMLQKGGIERYDVAGSKFGLAPSTACFWQNGVVEISNQIERLESLCDRAFGN